MTPNELMDKICNEADNQTSFYKELSDVAEKKDKLKYLNLLIEHFNCDYDCADKVIKFVFDNEPLPCTLTPQEIAHNNQVAADWFNKPKCPICGSTNLSKISMMKKATKIAAFGIFGMGDNGKTWKCNNCGSKF